MAKEATYEQRLIKQKMKGISGLFVLLYWCYFLTTVDAGNVMYTLTNGTLFATTESVTMQEIHSVQEAYSTTTKSTEDVASQRVDWKSWAVPFSVLVGFLLIAWGVLRRCSKNCTGYLERKRWSRLLCCLRCCGALQYVRVSITIDKETGYEWTSEGLSISPEINNFDDIREITITYCWDCRESPENHVDNSEDDDRERQIQSIPFLPPQNSNSFLFSKRPHVLKELDNTWQGVLTANASDKIYLAQCQIPVRRGFNLDEIKRQLKDLYNDKLGIGQIELLPWNKEYKERRELKDIFVELDLEQGDSTRREMVRKDLVKLKCKKNVNSFAKRVIIKGIAGSGKSSLLGKIAYDWSQGDYAFKEFELVFLLKLRELKKSTPVVDAIDNHILELDIFVKDGLEIYMKQNPSKVLILMDGWDETALDLEKGSRGMTIERMLLNEMLSESCVILSTRPHKHLKSENEYVSVKVQGFSQENVNVFINNMFKGEENADRLSTGLIEKLEHSSMLKAICNIPIILMLLCTIWKDIAYFPDTISGLYEKFAQIIWLRFCDARKNQSEDDESEKEQLIDFLGKMALDGLLPDSNIWEDTLSFLEDDFDRGLCKLGLEVGFITRQRKLQGAYEKCNIFFIHKSIQEFMAGRHLAQLFKNDSSLSSLFKEKLNLINSWELVLNKFEVLRFCCGISERSLATAVIGHVINKYVEIFKGSDEYERSVCKHNSDLRAGSTIYFGGVHPDFTMHARFTNCLPILTLLYEAQIKDDKMLASIFSESIFSKPMSVAVGYLDPHAKILFDYFHKVVPKAAANIRSIYFVYVHSVKQMINILSLLVPNQLECLVIYNIYANSFDNDMDINNMYADNDMGAIECRVVALTNLSTLALCNTSINMDDLLNRLDNSKTRLEHVDFTHTHIGSAIRHIGAIMTRYLTCLLLDGTSLSEEGIQILSGFLPRAPNLKMLNLAQNLIGNSIYPLTQNLMHCKKMQSLTLTQELLMGSSVQSLINCNDQLENNHVKTLINFFCNWSVYLLDLDLSNIPVREHITALSDYLQQYDQIEVLRLSCCGLTAGGIETISAVLPRSLMELDLSFNDVSDMSCIINGLQYCEELSLLNLGFIKLTDAGVVKLGQNLHKWCKLSTLGLLGNNDIRNNGLDSVLRNIHHLPKLTYFRISATIDSSCSTLVKDFVHAVGETIREEGGRLNINANNKRQIQSILDLSKAAKENDRR